MGGMFSGWSPAPHSVTYIMHLPSVNISNTNNTTNKCTVVARIQVIIRTKGGCAKMKICKTLMGPVATYGAESWTLNTHTHSLLFPLIRRYGKQSYRRYC